MAAIVVHPPRCGKGGQHLTPYALKTQRFLTKLTLVKRHLDPALWTQGDLRRWFNRLARDERQPESLGDCGKQKRGLHHSESGTDAHSGTATKRKIGEPGQPAVSNRIILPAIGAEPLGLRVETSIAVGDPLRHEYSRACGQAVLAYFEFLEGLPANSPSRREQPHGFLDDHFCVWQPTQVRKLRDPCAEHVAQFIVQLRFGFRMLGKQIPCPRERDRCCLMACDEKRHDFVAYLLVGHLAAFLIPKLQQDAKQILRASLSGAALADDAIDHCVQFLCGAAKARRAWEREEFRQKEGPIRQVHELIGYLVKRRSNSASIA